MDFGFLWYCMSRRRTINGSEATFSSSDFDAFEIPPVFNKQERKGTSCKHTWRRRLRGDEVFNNASCVERNG